MLKGAAHDCAYLWQVTPSAPSALQHHAITETRWGYSLAEMLTARYRDQLPAPRCAPDPRRTQRVFLLIAETKLSVHF